MSQGTGSKNSDTTTSHQVIDFGQARAQKLEEKRRATERIFFKHLLNVYSVVGDHSMVPIELIEVSEEGCSFQIPHNPQKPWPKNLEEIPIRIYFSQDTYLELRVKIKHSNPSIDNNQRYMRFGCVVDQNTASFVAYEQFVRFLKLYSEHSHKDLGDISVFYL